MPGCRRHFLDNALFFDRQDANLGRHDDEVVVGDDVAGRTQAVPVQRCADLAAIGEGNGCRAVPRLHQGRVVFVEGTTVVVHQRVAGPGFRDQHHGRMGERIATHDQELESVVEAGGVRLAFIGNRPELGDVVAEQRRRYGRLTRRHPVDVAAQRVDLTVVRNHPVGVRQIPGRERVGGKTLVDKGQGRRKALVLQVGVIGTELIGEEHAFVDDGPAGH